MAHTNTHARTTLRPSWLRARTGTAVSIAAVHLLAYMALAQSGSDDWANAPEITGDIYFGTLATATSEGVDSCSGTEGNADVWFRFTAPYDGRLMLSTGSTIASGGADTTLTLYDDDSAEASFCDGTVGADAMINDWALASGQSVVIRVSHTDGNLNGGHFALDVQYIAGMYTDVYDVPGDTRPSQIDSSTQTFIETRL